MICDEVEKANSQESPAGSGPVTREAQSESSFVSVSGRSELGEV
jgi:hypothetical protein